jgi:hypothetical protein
VVAYGRFEDVPREVFEGVMRANLLRSANVARSVLPAMRAAKRGHAMLVGSIIGHIAAPTMSAYAVSKGPSLFATHRQVVAATGGVLGGPPTAGWPSATIGAVGQASLRSACRSWCINICSIRQAKHEDATV